MDQPKIAIDPGRLLDVNFENTPTAARELCGHVEKYGKMGGDTVLDVSEEAARELEKVGGRRIEAGK